MPASIWRAYAKRGRLPDRPGDFLSLVDHSCDVAAVAAALLGLPTVAARLVRLAKRDLDAADRARLSVLVALHDAGKANVGFQHRIRGCSPGAGHILPLVSLLDAGSHGESAALKRDLRREFDCAIGLEDYARWCAEDPAPLLDAVLIHHGRLPKPAAVDFRLWQRSADYDPMAALRELSDAARVWFPEAFAAVAKPLPLAPRFLHAFAGLVMFADWLGSDGDRFRFPADGGTSGLARIGYARDVAARLLRDRFISPETWRPRALARPNGFRDLFPGIEQPRWPQQAMLGLPLPIGGSDRVVVLEAETGSGKTEAALIHFTELFRAGLVDGMYFALPTRAAAIQIHRRVASMLKGYLGDAAPPVGLAVPGYIRVDDREGLSLPSYDVLWQDDPADIWHDRGWAAEQPKRYLAGAVMVGTIDQVLLGGLRTRHAHLRSFPMLRLLLVVDEVHASDPYMEALLRHVLTQHRAAGGHALLLSATLGGAARAQLMGRAPDDVPTEAEACAAPYPLCSVTRGDGPDVERPAQTEKRVAVSLLETAEHEAVATQALEAARAGACVLVIRNLVRDAQALQCALQERAGVSGEIGLLFACNDRPAPHHARFAAEDRRLLDAALEDRFGKPARRPGVVAVTTQTAEQSLDIDADLMITDLCPADVLLQRIGRLHRHAGRVRPAGFERPRLAVLAPPIEELAGLLDARGEVRRSLHGLGRVYPDLLGAAATRLFLSRLSGALTIPGENRAFVEAATHPSALQELANRLGGAWPAHRGTILGIAAADRNLAAINGLQWDRELAPAWPGGEADERIGTRLGLGMRIAILADAVPGPFGEDVRTFLIPQWMAGGAAEDAAVVDVVTVGGGLTFGFGARRFRYSALGLELVGEASPAR